MQRVGKKHISKLSLSAIMLDNPASVWRDKTAKSISFFCRHKPVRVNKDLIMQLKGIAADSNNKNVRLCLHESPDAAFHDMLILEHRGNYYSPHKHLTKGESFHIIEGSMAVFTFDENGEITDSCRLSIEDTLIYRVGFDMYHAVMPLSDLVIYHEAKPGPFLGEKDSIYPDWAPRGDNLQGIMDYRNKLSDALERRGKT